MLGRAEMASVKYVYWKNEDWWLGYLEEFPDYWTQGQSLEELEEMLRDLYRDLNGGLVPGARRVGVLEV